MAENVKIPGEFDDANDWWPHPIYDNYEVNRLGVVRHVVKKKDIGSITNRGYLHMSLRYNGKSIDYQKHRFIYEAFHGLITDPKLVVDHKNNIKTDNKLQNLQLLTYSQNNKKNPRKGGNLAPISVRAINIKSGESTDYDSINKCSKDLDIDISSISRVLKGINKTATSKLDKNKYTFEKLNCETDTNSVKVRAINIKTGELKDYSSMNECSRSLNIKRESIRLVLKGQQKTGSNRKDKNKYTFEKVD